MYQLVSNIYETGEWPKNITEVAIILLKKKPKLQLVATVAQSASSHLQQRE